MVHKKYLRLIIPGAVIILFWISYNYGINKYKDSNMKKSSKNTIVSNLDRTVNTIYTEEKVDPESEIVIKTTYKKCGDVEFEELGKAEELNLNTSKDLNEYCKNRGYTLESNLKSAQIILAKSKDSYCPNKYVLGIADKLVNGETKQFITIFKTDANGEMRIEDESKDISDINIIMIKEQDRELLAKGSKEFQFDKREDAKDALGGYK